MHAANRALTNKTKFLAPRYARPKSMVKWKISGMHPRSAARMAKAGIKKIMIQSFHMFKQSFQSLSERFPGVTIRKSNLSLSGPSAFIGDIKLTNKSKKGVEIPENMNLSDDFKDKCVFRNGDPNSGVIHSIDKKHLKSLEDNVVSCSLKLLEYQNTPADKKTEKDENELKNFLTKAEKSYKEACEVSVLMKMDKDGSRYNSMEAIARSKIASIRAQSFAEVGSKAFVDKVNLERCKLKKESDEIIKTYSDVINLLNIDDANRMHKFVNGEVFNGMIDRQSDRTFVLGTRKLKDFSELRSDSGLSVFRGYDFFVGLVKTRAEYKKMNDESQKIEALKLFNNYCEDLKPQIEKNINEIMKNSSNESKSFDFNRTNELFHLKSLLKVTDKVSKLSEGLKTDANPKVGLSDYIETYGSDLGYGMGVDQQRFSRSLLHKYPDYLDACSETNQRYK